MKNMINRGSYTSAHVLLNLLNELGKRDKMRGLINKYSGEQETESIIHVRMG